MLIYAKVDGTSYQFERPAIDSREFHIGSWAKFCPHCLEGWAHMSAVDNGRMKSSHSVRGQLCWTCGLLLPKQALYYVPGSLLEEPQMNCQTLDWDLLDYLPRELLLREFKLHDQFFTRQDNSNGDTSKSNEIYDQSTPFDPDGKYIHTSYSGHERQE